jgi:hypothetical protein
MSHNTGSMIALEHAAGFGPTPASDTLSHCLVKLKECGNGLRWSTAKSTFSCDAEIFNHLYSRLILRFAPSNPSPR